MRFPRLPRLPHLPKSAIGVFAMVFMQIGGCAICGGYTPPDELHGLHCDQFYITTVTGFPYGPITVSWNELPLVNKYGIFIDGVAQDQIALPIAEHHINHPASKDTISLNTAIVNQSLTEKRQFSVTVQAFVNFDLVCTSNKIYAGTAPKTKKAKAQPTATVDVPIPPPQQPQPPQQDQPQPTQTNQPLAVTFVPIVIVTPCPNGYSGNPARGIPCIKIPS